MHLSVIFRYSSSSSETRHRNTKSTTYTGRHERLSLANRSFLGSTYSSRLFNDAPGHQSLTHQVGLARPRQLHGHATRNNKRTNMPRSEHVRSFPAPGCLADRERSGPQRGGRLGPDRAAPGHGVRQLRGGVHARPQGGRRQSKAPRRRALGGEKRERRAQKRNHGGYVGVFVTISSSRIRRQPCTTAQKTHTTGVHLPETNNFRWKRTHGRSCGKRNGSLVSKA